MPCLALLVVNVIVVHRLHGYLRPLVIGIDKPLVCGPASCLRHARVGWEIGALPAHRTATHTIAILYLASCTSHIIVI